MKIKLSDYENLIYLLVDIAMLNLSFLPMLIASNESLRDIYQSEVLVLLVFMNFSWLLVAKMRSDGISKPSRKFSYKRILRFVTTWIFSAILSLAFLSVIPYEIETSFVLKLYVVFMLLGLTARVVVAKLLVNYYKTHVNMRRMVVVGVNTFSINFVHHTIRNPELGYKFLGFFGKLGEGEETEDNTRVRKFGKIYDFLLNYDIDEVYISLPSAPDYHIKELIKFCHLNYIQVNFLNEFIHMLNKKTIQVNLDYEGATPIVSVAKEPLEMSANKLLKRMFDLAFSLFVMVFVFSWLFPIVALLIKMSSKGPVFFKQKRTGMDNRPFLCYKFRTMRVNVESDTKQATADDKRITRIGAFLRRSSLDEFPQFINVLKGEMSVVGPRPHMLAHTRMYAKIIEPFMVRHWVKPGITGLAQAKGFRGETEDVRQMYHRVKMDVFYIQNWNFWMDVRLVFETFWGMITSKNTGA